MEKPMTMEEAIEEVMRKPLVDLWPTAATLLDLSRSGVYDAAQRGEVDTLSIGRLRKAVSASLRKQLKMEVPCSTVLIPKQSGAR
jgi:hypothetical protein